MDEFDSFDSMGDFDIDGGFDDLEEGSVASSSPTEDIVRGIADSVIENKLETAANLTEAILPKNAKGVFGEGRNVIRQVSSVVDEAKEAALPSVKSFRDTTAALAGEDSILTSGFDWILDKLGYNESSGHMEESLDKKAENFVLAMLGERKDRDKAEIEEKAKLMSTQLTTNNILAKISAQFEVAEDTKYRLDDMFYRKSLELQFKQFIVQQDLLKTSKETNIKSLELLNKLVHNTGLPDMVKFNNTDLFKHRLTTNFFDRINTSISDKITEVVRTKLTDVTNAMSSTSDMTSMLDMIGEMGGMGMGMSKEYMAGNMAGGSIVQMIGGILGQKMSKYKSMRKLNTEAQKFQESPGDYFYEMAEGASGKRKEYLLRLGKFFNSMDYRGNLGSLKIKGEDAPAVFDNKVKNSIVTVIPTFLSKILAEITTLRQNGFGKVDSSVHELRYDENTGKLVTTNMVRKQFIKDYNKALDKTDLGKKIANFISLISKETGVKFTKTEMRKLTQKLIDYVNNGGELSIYAMQERSFTYDLHKRTVRKLMKVFKILNTKDDTFKSRVKETVRDLRRGVSTTELEEVLLKYKDMGVIPDIEKTGLVKISEGQVLIDEGRYKERVTKRALRELVDPDKRAEGINKVFDDRDKLEKSIERKEVAKDRLSRMKRKKRLEKADEIISNGLDKLNTVTPDSLDLSSENIKQKARSLAENPVDKITGFVKDKGKLLDSKIITKLESITDDEEYGPLARETLKLYKAGDIKAGTALKLIGKYSEGLKKRSEAIKRQIEDTNFFFDKENGEKSVLNKVIDYSIEDDYRKSVNETVKQKASETLNKAKDKVKKVYEETDNKIVNEIKTKVETVSNLIEDPKERKKFKFKVMRGLLKSKKSGKELLDEAKDIITKNYKEIQESDDKLKTIKEKANTVIDNTKETITDKASVMKAKAEKVIKDKVKDLDPNYEDKKPTKDQDKKSDEVTEEAIEKIEDVNQHDDETTGSIFSSLSALAMLQAGKFIEGFKGKGNHPFLKELGIFLKRKTAGIKESFNRGLRSVENKEWRTDTAKTVKSMAFTTEAHAQEPNSTVRGTFAKANQPKPILNRHSYLKKLTSMLPSLKTIGGLLSRTRTEQYTNAVTDMLIKGEITDPNQALQTILMIEQNEHLAEQNRQQQELIKATEKKDPLDKDGDSVRDGSWKTLFGNSEYETDKDGKPKSKKKVGGVLGLLLSALGLVLKPFKLMLSKLPELLGKIFGNYMKWGKKLFNGVKTLLTSSFGLGGLTSLVTGIWSKFKTLLDLPAMIGKAVGNYAKWGEKLWKLLTNEKWLHPFKAAKDWFKGFKEKLGSTLSESFKSVKDWLKASKSTISEKLATSLDKIRNSFNSAKSFFTGGSEGKNFLEVMKSGMNTRYDRMKEFFGIGKGETFFSKLGVFFTSLPGNLVDKFKESKLFTGISDSVNELKTFFSGINTSKLFEPVTNAITEIKSLVASIKDSSLVAKATKLAASIKEKAGTIGDAIKAKTSSAYSKVKNMVSTAYHKVSTKVKKVYNAGVKKAKAAYDTVKNSKVVKKVVETTVKTGKYIANSKIGKWVISKAGGILTVAGKVLTPLMVLQAGYHSKKSYDRGDKLGAAGWAVTGALYTSGIGTPFAMLLDYVLTKRDEALDAQSEAALAEARLEAGKVVKSCNGYSLYTYTKKGQPLQLLIPNKFIYGECKSGNGTVKDFGILSQDPKIDKLVEDMFKKGKPYEGSARDGICDRKVRVKFSNKYPAKEFNVNDHFPLCMLPKGKETKPKLTDIRDDIPKDDPNNKVVVPVTKIKQVVNNQTKEPVNNTPAPTMAATIPITTDAYLKTKTTASTTAPVTYQEDSKQDVNKASNRVKDNATKVPTEQKVKVAKESRQIKPTAIGTVGINNYVVSKGDKILLDFIFKGESEGSGGYEALIGGKKYLAALNGKALTKMTIHEVYQVQARLATMGAKSTAVGRYQFILPTLVETVNKLGLSENTIFSPVVQDKLILFRMEYKRGYYKWKSNIISDAEFGYGLAKEFASMPKPNNDGYYKGQNPKHKWVDVMKMLSEVRQLLGLVSNLNYPKPKDPDYNTVLPSVKQIIEEKDGLKGEQIENGARDSYDYKNALSPMSRYITEDLSTKDLNYVKKITGYKHRSVADRSEALDRFKQVYNPGVSGVTSANTGTSSNNCQVETINKVKQLQVQQGCPVPEIKADTVDPNNMNIPENKAVKLGETKICGIKTVRYALRGRVTEGPIKGQSIDHGSLKSVKHLVIHSTAGSKLYLGRFEKAGFGAQFYIDRDGTLHFINNVTSYFYHVGKRRPLYDHVKSSNSIGIELVQGHSYSKWGGWQPMTDAQKVTLRKLVSCLRAKFKIDTSQIYNHATISYKTPGEGEEGLKIAKNVTVTEVTLPFEAKTIGGKVGPTKENAKKLEETKVTDINKEEVTTKVENKVNNSRSDSKVNTSKKVEKPKERKSNSIDNISGLKPKDIKIESLTDPKSVKSKEELLKLIALTKIKLKDKNMRGDEPFVAKARLDGYLNRLVDFDLDYSEANTIVDKMIDKFTRDKKEPVVLGKADVRLKESTKSQLPASYSNFPKKDRTSTPKEHIVNAPLPKARDYRKSALREADEEGGILGALKLFSRTPILGDTRFGSVLRSMETHVGQIQLLFSSDGKHSIKKRFSDIWNRGIDRIKSHDTIVTKENETDKELSKRMSIQQEKAVTDVKKEIKESVKEEISKTDSDPKIVLDHKPLVEAIKDSSPNKAINESNRLLQETNANTKQMVDLLNKLVTQNSQVQTNNTTKIEKPKDNESNTYQTKRRELKQYSPIMSDKRSRYDT